MNPYSKKPVWGWVVENPVFYPGTEEGDFIVFHDNKCFWFRPRSVNEYKFIAFIPDYDMCEVKHAKHTFLPAYVLDRALR